MRIVLATDENFVGQTGVCIKSIALAHAGRPDLSVTVLLGDVSAQSKGTLLQYTDQLPIDVRAIDVDTSDLREITDGLPTNKVTVGALLPLKMGALLPSEWTRVLYLDADVLVTRDLGALFEMDLNGNIVAARREASRYLRRYGVPQSTYFNSGVMVVDLAAWRRESVEQRALALLQEMPDQLTNWARCALNIALKNNTEAILESYNSCLYGYKINRGDPIPHVIHWSGAIKPWPNAYVAPWGELYFRMSADTPWPTNYCPPNEPTRTLRQRLEDRLRALAFKRG